MTIVESVIALTVLSIFLVTSTMALNLFDTRAAQNRNLEAARAVVDDYLTYLLDDNTPIPTATTGNTDLDGDGVSDGVPCTAIPGRAIATTLPLVESRTPPTVPPVPPIVSGSLYWRVQNVGSSFGLSNDADLVQVNFTFSYNYRGKNYYYKAVTYKGK